MDKASLRKNPIFLALISPLALIAGKTRPRASLQTIALPYSSPALRDWMVVEQNFLVAGGSAAPENRTKTSKPTT
jgi:hypothetical protein